MIAEAEGETSRFLASLSEYEKAPEVTRERLYLETMEKVLAETSKVLLDVKERQQPDVSAPGQMLKQAAAGQASQPRRSGARRQEPQPRPSVKSSRAGGPADESAKMLAPIGLVVWPCGLRVHLHRQPVGSRAEAAARRDRRQRYEPGLHWMVPVLNNVKKFDGRIQTLDSRPSASSRREERT